MHIADPARRRWVQERIEQPIPAIDGQAALERLVRAELFEEVLHGRYPGSKRFSLEGVAGLIPLLDDVLDEAAGGGLEEALIGMSHRGRLNVMVQIVGRRCSTSMQASRIPIRRACSAAATSSTTWERPAPIGLEAAGTFG